MIGPRLPHPVLRRRLRRRNAVGLVVGFAFVAFFTSALHDPRPNALPVGVVGPAPVARCSCSRASTAPSRAGSTSTATPTSASARAAIRSQDVDGAYLPGPGARRGCWSPARTARAPSPSCGRPSAGPPPRAHEALTVEDVAPVPGHDARGISAFFLVAGTTLGSLVFGIVLFFAGGHAITTPLRIRLALIAVFAVLAGLVMAIDHRLPGQRSDRRVLDRRRDRGAARGRGGADDDRAGALARDAGHRAQRRVPDAVQPPGHRRADRPGVRARLLPRRRPGAAEPRRAQRAARRGLPRAAAARRHRSRSWLPGPPWPWRCSSRRTACARSRRARRSAAHRSTLTSQAPDRLDPQPVEQA